MEAVHARIVEQNMKLRLLAEELVGSPLDGSEIREVELKEDGIHQDGRKEETRRASGGINKCEDKCFIRATTGAPIKGAAIADTAPQIHHYKASLVLIVNSQRVAGAERAERDSGVHVDGDAVPRLQPRW